MNSSQQRLEQAAAGAGRSDASRIEGAVAAFRAERRLRNSRTREAADLLKSNQPDAARVRLSKFLGKNPRDASALNLMGEIVSRAGNYGEAESLFAQCLELSPDFELARFNYAFALYNLNRLPGALDQLERLLQTEPHNFLALDLKSVVLGLMGRFRESMLCRRQLIKDYPGDSELWIKYGSALRSLGDREAASAAYRKAIELRHSAGAAWWNLAELKTYRFSDAEVATMRDQLGRDDLARQDRIYLHFAIGKALSDRGEYGLSFDNYARANALKRAAVEYNPDDFARHVAHCKSVFTSDFFSSRHGSGCPAPDPIFIVGMQRAGSTLVEQILASHSAIEATAELPDISLLAQRIGTHLTPAAGYPEGLTELKTTNFEQFGREYLDSTRFRRALGRARFLDKMPYNFLHLGLIHLILPHAKIVDVRRHPMACCFSNFSLHFESGPLFSHRLSELGRAYADYVAQLAHFDSVLPGRIHRIFYEDLVRNSEHEVRRLLDYLELPFEDSCLRFHESARAMSSVSAEQVRRPISTEAVDYWRNYEPWLGPLKQALGPVLDAYPAVPSFVP